MNVFDQILEQLKKITTTTSKTGVGKDKGGLLGEAARVISKLPGLGWFGKILYDLNSLIKISKSGFNGVINSINRSTSFDRSKPYEDSAEGKRSFKREALEFLKSKSSIKILRPIFKTLHSFLKSIGTPLFLRGLAYRGTNGIFGGIAKASFGQVAFPALFKLLKNPFTIVATAAILTATALYKLGKASYNAAKAQLEIQRKFTQYNGRLLQSYAVAELKDIVRNIKYAEMTADSTIRLQKAFNALKDTLAPVQAFFTNLKNRIITFGVQYTNANLSGWGMITGLRDHSEVEGMGEWWYGVQDKLTDWILKWEGMSEEERKNQQKIIEELRKIRENSKYVNTPLERFLSDVASRGLDANKGAAPQKRLFFPAPAVR